MEVFVATSAHIDHMKIKSKTRGEARIWVMAGAFSVMASGGESDRTRGFLADAGTGEDFGQGIVGGVRKIFAKVNRELAGLCRREAREVAMGDQTARTQQRGIEAG